MKRFLVKNSHVQGHLAIPSSKSHSLRAILYGTLASGRTLIQHYLPSPDIYAMIKACTSLGASIELHNNMLEITGLSGKIQGADDVIQAQNSGIVLRFISAIAALGSEPIVITGDHSIRTQRPIQALLDGLNQLGASAISTRNNSKAPVVIRGPIKGGSATLSGEDSQPVSALLTAAAFAPETSTIQVVNAGEKPWIDLSLKWFDFLGIPYKAKDYACYHLEGNARIKGFNYDVPGDLSSLSFPLAAALLTNSELTMSNVDMEEPQGDKQLIHVLKNMGANIEIDSQHKRLHVRKGGQLQGITVDINDFIDSLPILATVACFAEGETHLTNAEIARHKECNRLECIAKELRKMGADIDVLQEGLIIHGGKPLKGATVYSHDDHRIAMSLAMAGLAAEGETVIESVACVAKTYPTFIRDFQQIAAHIVEV